MYRGIQKTLDWGVKVASLAITGPATWVVATQLFADIPEPFRYLMQFSAVFLIEGVLLSNWLLLEFDKSALPEIKARYGLTALTIYTALLVIGWRHEGPTGIVFRLALLAALIGSGWDTYVYTWHRLTANVDRSPENSGKVRSHARKLAIKEAIIRREAEHDATLALISAERTASLEHSGLYGQRLIQSIRLEDKAEKIKLLERESLLDAGTNGKKKGLHSLPPVVMGQTSRPTFDYIADVSPGNQHLKRSILDALAEEPNYNSVNLSEKLGITAEEAEVAMGELLEDGVIYREGRAHFIMSEAEIRSNGKRLKARPRPRER